MFSTKNIIILLSAIFCIGLGIEGYFYIQASRFSTNKTIVTRTVFKTTPEPTPSAVDIKGSVALVGYLNLFDINKVQVGEWAKTQGIVTVPIYSGPPTTSDTSTLTRAPVSVMAGYFKGTESGGVILSQGEKDIKVIFNSGAGLWIKDGNKLQMVSGTLGLLLSSNSLDQFVKPNDLILALNVLEESGQFITSTLVIFR